MPTVASSSERSEDRPGLSNSVASGTAASNSKESGLSRPFLSLGTKIVNFLVPSSMKMAPALKFPPFPVIPIRDDRRTPESWWDAIFTGQKSPNDYENITISKVRWFKDKGGLGHECLVFTVDVERPAYTGFVAIERSTKKELVLAALRISDPLTHVLPEVTVASLTDADKISFRKTLANKLREELKLVKSRCNQYYSVPGRGPPVNLNHKPQPLLAFDMITRVDISDHVEPTPESFKAECLETLTFDKPGAPKFYLRDLGLMVLEIHNRQPNWSLRAYNSFWFARTLVDVITAMKDPQTQSPELVNKLAGCSANIGKFGRIVRPNQAEVSELIVKIKDAIRANDQMVADKWEAGEGGKIKVEAELAITQKAVAAARATLADIEGNLAVAEETLIGERAANAQEKKQMEAKLAELEAQVLAAGSSLVRKKGELYDS